MTDCQPVTSTTPAPLPALAAATANNSRVMGYWPYVVFTLAAIAMVFLKSSPAAYDRVAELLAKAGVVMPARAKSAVAEPPPGVTDVNSLHRKMGTVGAKVYGSSSCMWSNKQRAELGIDVHSEFYVNCDTGDCDGITGYPTWEVNGIRRPGFMSAADADALFDKILQDTYTKHMQDSQIPPVSASDPTPVDVAFAASETNTEEGDSGAGDSVGVVDEETTAPDIGGAIAKGVELHLTGGKKEH